ncbi:MAG TPA: DUF4954 family protein, partial [Chitinophagaceae bacterium]|nr:DUF4954 family protein [Chitinophagaceae bacterium]
EGEDEAVRIWLEVCNENAGRKILPFNGMLPGDAYLWSKYRNDKELMNRFKEFTEAKFDKQRGYYGKIGDRTVIKNTSIIKDVWVGSNAYIKGANKLKNLTINSQEDAQTQIGEGCELVNGIIDIGCRAFYGVKAVRFFMASHSQLKYGARLINSYLGNNATISCCEVLNSLIFPAHEQHHNNSFLCAAVVMGQSNMAAGATIGSNHNSRAADGEIVAGRGFWPGLCVSLKHNSKFASYTLIAKGDFPAELNITLPFSLVSNDVSSNRLVIMPAYWFMYNMYALARNAHKYIERDKRIEKLPYIEYDFLAPDTVNELFEGLNVLRKLVAATSIGTIGDDAYLVQQGDKILNEKRSEIKNIEVNECIFENVKRPTQITKVWEAYAVYKELIILYAVKELVALTSAREIDSFQELKNQLPSSLSRSRWKNIGGLLVEDESLKHFIENIRSGKIKNWDGVHHFYDQAGKNYQEQKLHHAYASMLEVLNIASENFSEDVFKQAAEQALNTKQWMVERIMQSRAKDYQNEFRTMVYDNQEEMNEVVGKLDENAFIQQQEEEFSVFKSEVTRTLKTFGLQQEVASRETEKATKVSMVD